MDLFHIYKNNFQTNFCDTEKDFTYHLCEKYMNTRANRGFQEKSGGGLKSPEISPPTQK